METPASNTYVNFNWIPGHKVVEGNERADRAASEGRTKTEKTNYLLNSNSKIHYRHSNEVYVNNSQFLCE